MVRALMWPRHRVLFCILVPGSIIVFAGFDPVTRTAAGALVVVLVPDVNRHVPFEFRYPLAGASGALVATALHEALGCDLQTLAKRALLAARVGLAGGVDRFRSRRNIEEQQT